MVRTPLLVTGSFVSDTLFQARQEQSASLLFSANIVLSSLGSVLTDLVSEPVLRSPSAAQGCSISEQLPLYFLKNYFLSISPSSPQTHIHTDFNQLSFAFGRYQIPASLNDEWEA